MAGESAGQMVAEWVDAWAPAVFDALAETEQPETSVLDSTDFWWTNSSTKTRRREFAILVAYGHTGPGKGRVWEASRVITITPAVLTVLAHREDQASVGHRKLRSTNA